MASANDVPTRRDPVRSAEGDPLRYPEEGSGLPPPPPTAPSAPPRPSAPPPDVRPSPPPSAGARTRRLTRSRSDQVLGGVCGGLGRYLNVDPVILRIAFVALTLGGGAGVLLYIIAWIAIPEEPEGVPRDAGEAPAGAARLSSRSGTLLLGGVLVVLGLLLLLDQLLPGLRDLTWPMVVIGIGVAMVVSTRREV